MTDLERWRAMWGAFGADEAYQLELFDELQRCYAELGRVYHTLAHIRDCLRQFDLVRRLAGHPPQVECALWFHDVIYDPASAGRQMNAHFASRNLYPNGSWRAQTKMYNTAADVSPTGTQMPRAVGLAYASIVYRKLEELHEFKDFSTRLSYSLAADVTPSMKLR